MTSDISSILARMSSLDTRAVHAARDGMDGHVPPIDLSTTYPLPDIAVGGASYDVLAAGGRPDGGSLVYQRLWNPTVDRFERALAALEECDEAVGFASGMAALSACLLAIAADGKGHVVAVRPLYGGTDHVLATGVLGTEVSWAADGDVGAAIRPETGLIVVETPANPTLDLVDLDEITAHGVPVLVDNTFATPVLQRPAAHGAALVLHSATKFIGGHGDVMGGVVAGDSEWAARLRQIRAVTGAIMHPLAAYLLHRGLQTLPVRMRAQQASARKLADWLAEHPSVEHVYYPQADVGKQMSGPGAVLAFRARGGYPAAARIAESCRLITHAVSLGGVDTLIQHPAALTHRPVEAGARPDDAVLRISVGLEDPDDLIADLDSAFTGME
jgi:methionine-gamma-lyase